MNPNKSALARKRDLAKAGMAVSMGTLLATGFFERVTSDRGALARDLHLVSGLALVGFSYWHWSLYQRDVKNRGNAA